MWFVISKIDECDGVSDVIKSVNIRWVAEGMGGSIEGYNLKVFQESGYLR